MRHWYYCFISFMILLTGCSLLQGDDTEPEPTATAEIPTPVVTPTLRPTDEPSNTENGAPKSSLNVWLIPELGSDSESIGSLLLNEQLAAFASSHPDLDLNIEVKSISGQGGTLNYLRTGRDVAPDVLPDLIIINSEHLGTAAVEELIFPIDTLITTEMIDDLFPAAEAVSKAGDMMYGYPQYLVNFQHVAYNDAVLEDPPPETWDEMLEMEDASFVFPAGGLGGAELALQLYLASGGQLAEEGAQPLLEVEPLTNALNLLGRGRNQGSIAPSSQNISTMKQAWDFYSNSSSNIVQTDSPILLAARAAGDDSDFVPLPGPSGPMYPLLNGWLWAVSTPDPVGQALAAELLSWLASSQNMGEWSLESGQLPSRMSAFDSWPSEDPYTEFLMSQLNFANPYPEGATSAVMNALREAVFDVISQTKSARSAAEDAVALIEG